MKFSRKPFNISFYCPMCHNKTLYCVDHDCSRPSDVDWHDNFVCDECGAEVVSEPQYDNKIRFVQDIESAEDIQSRHETKPIDIVYDTEHGYGLVKYDPKVASDKYGNKWLPVEWQDGTTTVCLLSTLNFVNYRFQHSDYDEYYEFMESIGRPVAESVSVKCESVPERPLDPPEDNRWNEQDDYEAVIELPLDAIIFVDDDGNWDYEDENYPWAKGDSKNGDWYDEENNIYLGDKVDMVEKTDDLLFKYIPARVGTYHISGNVKLVFDISGVEEKVTDAWYDEDHGYDYDSEINTDFVDVDYLEDKSEIQNFKMQPVDE